jgi:hypothetical protein
MAADDGVPDLSAFQLEVATLFFALPGRPKTSTSSPLPNAGMFLPRAMR